VKQHLIPKSLDPSAGAILGGGGVDVLKAERFICWVTSLFILKSDLPSLGNLLYSTLILLEPSSLPLVSSCTSAVYHLLCITVMHMYFSQAFSSLSLSSANLVLQVTCTKFVHVSTCKNKRQATF
jgi:hypothetical protein